MSVSPSIPLRDPAWRGRVTWLVLGAALLWPMLVASEFEPWRLFDEQAIAAASGFLASFLPPAVGGEFLLLVAEAAWITVATATAGLALALVGIDPPVRGPHATQLYAEVLRRAGLAETPE